MATRNEDVRTEDIVRLRTEGMSFAEIAKTLGVGLAFVKSRWFKSGEQSTAWRKWEKVKHESMQLWNEGLTISDISERLGVPLEHVSDALRNQGITKQSIKIRVADFQRRRAKLNIIGEEIVSMYNLGWSQYKIAKELGVPRTSIETALHRHGVKNKSNGSPKRYDPQVRQAVVQAALNGQKWSEISLQFGVPVYCVANWMLAERKRQAKEGRQ